jgi:hypothetical protein
MYSVIRRLYRHKRDDWHSRRVALFLQLMRPEVGATILDVGGGDGEFMQRVRAHTDVRATIADIDEAALAAARARGFATVSLREGERLPFRDREFDIVFANSVIEHVTLPKVLCISEQFSQAEWIAASRQSQAAFAHELRRIGSSYFIQTPHAAFPIESHTWLPFVGWLSHDATVRLVRLTDRVWAKHCGYVDWCLLDEREMKRLLPDADLHVERMCGFPKSLIAYSRGEHGPARRGLNDDSKP